MRRWVLRTLSWMWRAIGFHWLPEPRRFAARLALFYVVTAALLWWFHAPAPRLSKELRLPQWGGYGYESSATGLTLLALCYDNSTADHFQVFRLWDLDTGAERGVGGPRDRVWQEALAPDGSLLFLRSAPGYKGPFEIV